MNITRAAATSVWFVIVVLPCMNARASVPLSGTYKSSGQAEAAFDSAVAGMLGDGVNAIETFSIQPSQNVNGLIIEYNVRSAGGAESGWVAQGQKAGKQGTAVVAVSFRLAGPNANKFDIAYVITTDTGPLAGIVNEWTTIEGTPITFVTVILSTKVEITSINQLPGGEQQDFRNSQTGKAAEQRKAKGASVTGTVLSAVGAVIGFIYLGPQGAIGGAIFGYALGTSLENGTVALVGGHLPAMQDIYGKINAHVRAFKVIDAPLIEIIDAICSA